MKTSVFTPVPFDSLVAKITNLTVSNNYHECVYLLLKRKRSKP